MNDREFILTGRVFPENHGRQSENPGVLVTFWRFKPAFDKLYYRSARKTLLPTPVFVTLHWRRFPLNSINLPDQDPCIRRFAVHRATFDFASRSDSSDAKFVARIRSAGNPYCWILIWVLVTQNSRCQFPSRLRQRQLRRLSPKSLRNFVPQLRQWPVRLRLLFECPSVRVQCRPIARTTHRHGRLRVLPTASPGDARDVEQRSLIAMRREVRRRP